MNDAQAKSGRKTPPIDSLSQEMRGFYTALGLFNTTVGNLVSQAKGDPETVKPLTDAILVFCEVHANQCAAAGADYIWEPATHTCIRKSDTTDPGEGGPIG